MDTVFLQINQSAAPEFGPTLVQTVVPDPRQVHRRSLLSVLCVSYRSNLIHYQGQMWSPATTPRVRNAWEHVSSDAGNWCPYLCVHGDHIYRGQRRPSVFFGGEGEFNYNHKVQTGSQKKKKKVFCHTWTWLTKHTNLTGFWNMGVYVSSRSDNWPFAENKTTFSWQSTAGMADPRHCSPAGPLSEWRWVKYQVSGPHVCSTVIHRAIQPWQQEHTVCWHDSR